MSENQVNPIAFTKSEAIQVIIAGIQSGAIKFPFSNALNDQKIDQLIKTRMNNCVDNFPREVLLKRIEGLTIANECATLARRDALYLLTLLTTLTQGITEKEAESIIRTAID